nr:hypothetical protein [Tanacetum cinerariifolium]
MKPKKSRRVAKWAIELGEHDIEFQKRGLMMIDPEGKEYTYAPRFGFETTNNEVEYEALLDQLQIAQDIEITSLAIFLDSQLKEDPKESKKIRAKEPQYKLIRGSLYRIYFYTPWLRYVALPLTDDIVKEIHEAPGGFKFLALAVEHSTKWVEAKPMTTISGRHAKRFVTQSFFPITEHMEIMNHIEKKLARSQQGWVDDLAQILWVHRTLPRNNQKETPFSLTYDSKAIIPISENNVAKNDRGRIKEVDKRRESKEVASIEDAYYRNKLRK